MNFKFYIILQFSIYYHCGSGKGEKYLYIDDGLKLPIFGSYSYDPVKQMFESSNATIQNQFGNKSYTGSTIIIGDEARSTYVYPITTGNTNVAFKKRSVLNETETTRLQTTNWWKRTKPFINKFNIL